MITQDTDLSEHSIITSAKRFIFNIAPAYESGAILDLGCPSLLPSFQYLMCRYLIFATFLTLIIDYLKRI